MNTQNERWTWLGSAFQNKSGNEVPAVLVDIDGVISNANHRQHFVRFKDGPQKGQKKPSAEQDWKGFFAACVADPPISRMVDFLGWLDSNVAIILLTARPHSVHKETVDWLKDNQIRSDLLVIRTKADNSLSAQDFKARAIRELLADGFNVLLGFEDDPKNVEVYKEAGVPCVYIHSGYYTDKGPSDAAT